MEHGLQQYPDKHAEVSVHGLDRVTAIRDERATAHNSAYVHRRPCGRLGLRGAAARRSATWPLALVGLGAASHTCDTLCETRKEFLLDQLGQLDYTSTMKTLPLAEVKTNFSSLLKEVQTGSEIAISYGKKRETIAVIVSYKEYKRSKKRKLGTLKGKDESHLRERFRND